MKEIEAIISGRVTGVMFRDFVQRKARALWLSGYVENIPDYRVRVVAQGPEDKLKRLVDHLWKGPFVARVSDVSVMWRESETEHEDFIILY